MPLFIGYNCRFMSSELDLDEEIKSLHSLATTPELYPELVQLNVISSLLSLLNHENTGKTILILARSRTQLIRFAMIIDIVIDVIDLFHELTEPDTLQEAEESIALVDALVIATP